MYKKLCLYIPGEYNLSIPHIDKLSICRIETKLYIQHIYHFSIFYVSKFSISGIDKNSFSIPNLDGKVLPVPHEENFSLPHIGTRFFFICHVVKFSACDIEKCMFI